MHHSLDLLYIDQYGLPVQRDGDGGDTAQRVGWAWFGIGIRNQLLNKPWHRTFVCNFDSMLNLLEIEKSGEFCRHPHQGGWKSNPDDFSRDQLTPLVAAMGLWQQTERLQRSWDALRPCYEILKCVQGTKDLAGPDLVNLFNRAKGREPEEAGDTFLAAGVAVRLVQALQNPDDVGDDLNLTVQLLSALIWKPTDTVRQAAFAYAKNRPVSRGCYLSTYREEYGLEFSTSEATMAERIDDGMRRGWAPDCPRILGALRWYFRAETGASSALAELYAPIVDEYLS